MIIVFVGAFYSISNKTWPWFSSFCVHVTDILVIVLFNIKRITRANSSATHWPKCRRLYTCVCYPSQHIFCIICYVPKCLYLVTFGKFHVIIIIKLEVSIFPVVIIFFRGCVLVMFVTSYSVTYCIYVSGKPGICFHYYCAVYNECKYSDTFWLADRTRLFVQSTILLSSLCKLVWRHWTYKMPVRYILSSV